MDVDVDVEGRGMVVLVDAGAVVVRFESGLRVVDVLRLWL